MSDQLPPLTLTAEDSDGDTQIVASLDLNNAKILNNKTLNPVTLDVAVPALNLTDVYAKNVTIPLDFSIIPPVVTEFQLVRYPLNYVGGGGGYEIGYPDVIDNRISANSFSYNDSSNKIYLFREEPASSSDVYIFIQVGYIVDTGSNFEPGYYRIILDVVNGSYLNNETTYNDGFGYSIYPHNYYYYTSLTGLSGYNRFVLTGFGNIPGTGRIGQRLFNIYEESPQEQSGDEVAYSPTYNESAVLRLSTQMVSFGNWFN